MVGEWRMWREVYVGCVFGGFLAIGAVNRRGVLSIAMGLVVVVKRWRVMWRQGPSKRSRLWIGGYLK